MGSKNKKPLFGSVSSGTMRLEDLIPTFTEEVEYYTPSVAKKIRKEYNSVYLAIEEGEEFDGEDAAWLLDKLFDALNDIAARVPYMYFGAYEGDGSDYGFWLSYDELRHDIKDERVLQWQNSQRRPSKAELGDAGYYLEVNDHGNMTLFARNYKEIWSL